MTRRARAAAAPPFSRKPGPGFGGCFAAGAVLVSRIMVRHNVYFWLDPALTDEQKASFEGGLRALFRIDVVAAGSFGKAAATPVRPVTRNTFDYALVLEFDSVAAHDAYQVHPEHDVFVKAFSPWFREVRVFDTQF